MRKTLIVTLAVLAAAVAVCALSMHALNGAVDRANRLRSAAVLAEEENRISDAKAAMLELAEFWRRKASLLEMMASHDALHEVQSAVAEAQICLECEDRDDFLRCMAIVEENLNHIRDEQSPRLSNLY